MLMCVACLCGGADNWIRSKLKKFNFSKALLIPITKGKEKSLSMVSTLPQVQETTDLAAHIRASSKFAIIIGTDGQTVRWVDIVNGTYIKNDVDAEFIIRDYGGTSQK